MNRRIQWTSLFVIALPNGLTAQTANWTQQSPAASPSGRGTPAMAYDSKHSQVVLFSGATGAAAQSEPNDTWTWDGTNWTLNHPAQSPEPRSNSAMFFVPNSAPLGIDPVVVTVAGVNSNTANLPVGAAPAIGAVLNAASFGSTNTVSPGSIVSIFGASLGTQDNASAFPSSNVNGTTVLFGSVAAPVFAALPIEGQLNVLVPTELADNGTVNLTVQTAGGTSSALSLNLVPATPAAFAFTDPLVTSRRNAAAVAANTAWIAMPLSMAANMGLPSNCSSLGAATLCGEPAHPGDYLQIYATGLGKATPNGDPAGAVLPSGQVAPASGSPLYATVATPSVTIGGLPATVIFSGIGPGYAGLYQLDVQIPAGVTPGDDVPLAISMPGSSTDTTTIAIAK